MRKSRRSAKRKASGSRNWYGCLILGHISRFQAEGPKCLTSFSDPIPNGRDTCSGYINLTNLFFFLWIYVRWQKQADCEHAKVTQISKIVTFELAWRCSGNLPRSRNAKILLRHSDMCQLPLLNRLVERVAMKRPGRANCASTQCQMRLDQLIWTGLLVGLRLLSFALVEVTAVTGWLAD